MTGMNVSNGLLALTGSVVFLDKHCLNTGEDWQTGFLRGLNNALVICILISAKALQGIVENAATKQDNYLLEIEMALARAEAGTCHVLPCFVGQYHTSKCTSNPPVACGLCTSSLTVCF